VFGGAEEAVRVVVNDLRVSELSVYCPYGELSLLLPRQRAGAVSSRTLASAIRQKRTEVYLRQKRHPALLTVRIAHIPQPTIPLKIMMMRCFSHWRVKYLLELHAVAALVAPDPSVVGHRSSRIIGLLLIELSPICTIDEQITEDPKERVFRSDPKSTWKNVNNPGYGIVKT